MADTLQIRVDDSQVQALLDKLVARLSNTKPLFAQIAEAMASETEHNFETESGPLGAWPKLAESTIAERLKRGTWPGQILQRSGQLAASVQTRHGNDFASIGSNKVYAAIHQLGGPAGRGLKTQIKARPYLPIRPDGRLQDRAQKTLLEILESYLTRV